MSTVSREICALVLVPIYDVHSGLSKLSSEEPAWNVRSRWVWLGEYMEVL